MNVQDKIRLSPDEAKSVKIESSKHYVSDLYKVTDSEWALIDRQVKKASEFYERLVGCDVDEVYARGYEEGEEKSKAMEMSRIGNALSRLGVAVATIDEALARKGGK